VIDGRKRRNLTVSPIGAGEDRKSAFTSMPARSRRAKGMAVKEQRRPKKAMETPARPLNLASFDTRTSLR